MTSYYVMTFLSAATPDDAQKGGGGTRLRDRLSAFLFASPVRARVQAGASA